jgi:hypothetical protein
MSIAWCDGRVGIVGMWVSLGCGLRAENRAQEQKIETNIHHECSALKELAKMTLT